MIERLVGPRMGERQQLEQLSVVVEHFFKVRDQPAGVDRVAGKPAAEVIVDAAFADAIEGELGKFEPARLAAQAMAPEQFEQGCLGELWRAVEPAIDRIDGAGDLASKTVELGWSDDDSAFGPRIGGETLHQRAAVGFYAIGLVAKQAGELAQNVDKSRPAVACGLGKICAAPDRLAAGREKHGERPAAVLAQ